MLCPALAAHRSLFVSWNTDKQYSHLPVFLQDYLEDEGWEGVLSMTKTIFSSADGEWPIYSVWKKLLQMLLTVKYFHYELSDSLFQLYILFYLMVQEYHETMHTLNHSESEIKLLSTNWYNFGGFLVSWSDSSSANFNFYCH